MILQKNKQHKIPFKTNSFSYYYNKIIGDEGILGDFISSLLFGGTLIVNIFSGYQVFINYSALPPYIPIWLIFEEKYQITSRFFLPLIPMFSIIINIFSLLLALFIYSNYKAISRITLFFSFIINIFMYLALINIINMVK